MNRRKGKLQNKHFCRLVEIACIGSFLFLVGLIMVRLVCQYHNNEEERAARQSKEIMSEDEKSTDSPLSAEDSSQNSSVPPPEVFKHAQDLLKQNADLVGVVAFGDMALYVCQTQDNAYYANHRFDGSEDPAGMIYMDCRCSIWPMSDNVILYGHNMRNGSRFGKLKRLTQKDYLERYPTVRFASLYEIYAYRPIAIFYANVDPESVDYFPFDKVAFEDAETFDNWIHEIQTRSVVNLSVTAQYGDQLLTLATCSENEDGGRLVVVCAQE